MNPVQKPPHQMLLSLVRIRVDPKTREEVIRGTAELLLEALGIKPTVGKEGNHEKR